MANKKIFASAPKARAADAINEAGGRAYAFTPEHALAQYAATGTFQHTFYATESEQLDKTLQLAAQCDPVFVAKTAVFARTHGYMKDMPAFLAAYLAGKDVKLLSAIFPKVVDSGKMLRNFVQIVRSGVVGRKSFGTAPKRLARAWFDARSPETIFRQSLGNDPSIADVIKLVRPAPKKANGETDVVRQALYGWLIGREVDAANLPEIVRAFEAYRKGQSTDVPQVPFEMLTALPLDAAAWKAIGKGMSWTQLRMNLNTLARHGVFESKELVKHVASKLSNEREVRRARAFPYQLMSAFKAASALPSEISIALQKAMEIATENVPSIPGKVWICPDVSGSMHSSVTGHRKGATSAVRCIDVAALIAASILRKNPTAEILPFSDHVVDVPRGALNPLDSVMTNANVLAQLPSGGTACSAPLLRLNERKEKADLIVYVSDNMSWVDFAGHAYGQQKGRPTKMAEEWATFRRRNPGAKLVLVDLQPYATTQVGEATDVLNVGGFSDRVFDIVASFAKGELEGAHWVDRIRSIEL